MQSISTRSSVQSTQFSNDENQIQLKYFKEKQEKYSVQYWETDNKVSENFVTDVASGLKENDRKENVDGQRKTLIKDIIKSAETNIDMKNRIIRNLD